MRRAGNAPHTSSTASTSSFRIGFSYEHLAGALAARVNGLLHAADVRKFSPPFRIVILSQQGAVVYECEVREDGRVSHRARPPRIRRSHFPATMFFTDGLQITRTFQIERRTSRA